MSYGKDGELPYSRRIFFRLCAVWFPAIHVFPLEGSRNKLAYSDQRRSIFPFFPVLPALRGVQFGKLPCPGFMAWYFLYPQTMPTLKNMSYPGRTVCRRLLYSRWGLWLLAFWVCIGMHLRVSTTKWGGDCLSECGVFGDHAMHHPLLETENNLKIKPKPTLRLLEVSKCTLINSLLS